jgi:hypothetical protein
MVTTIDAPEYDQEVAEQAGQLAEWAREDVGRGTAYEDEKGAVYDLVHDLLDAHPWFFRTKYGPAAHGCIIEHADEAGIDPNRHTDFAALTESSDPADAIKKSAYLVFESHVIEAAIERLGDDE